MKLYRAVSSFNGESIQFNHYIKKPRQPRDTELALHTVCDSWFYHNYGIYARSQTIFCSPCRLEAAKYLVNGGVMLELEIPKNEFFSAIYSLSVSDLFSETRHLNSPYDNKEVWNLLASKAYQVTNDLSTIPVFFKGEIMLYIEKFSAREV